MTLQGVITKFAARSYNGKEYWDLIVADTTADPRQRFLSEVELSRFDGPQLAKDGLQEGDEVSLRVRKVASLRNGNPVVEGILTVTKPLKPTK